MKRSRLPRPQCAIVFGFAALAFYSSPAGAGTIQAWYVDCGSGNDQADGRTPSSAWKSTQKVSSQRFEPGNVIYFRRGSVCSGMLSPHGSGSAQAPIRLDAWGTGPLPRIQASAGQEAALELSDQEYWTIQHFDLSGGDPYGIYITGSKRVLHGIQLKDVLVHDVTGQPKDKETGLVVIAATTQESHFDNVLIDGVTAYRTTQWAGIMVAGVKHGFPPETSRNTNVIIRNSIAHDVAGDGIVLFQVNHGLIENSAAWRTGMQQTQTIGTPNAIWTWMCRDCIVRHNEAFLTDSPGVDGGAFDIDYGNDANIVEENYGHDTQGYCVAVFGAGWTTSNSIVRNNTCISNGLSPRGANYQGAVFLLTWNNGGIKDLEISGNRIIWNPPLAAAAIVNIAALTGPATFRKNSVESSSPVLVRSNTALQFDENSYSYCGAGTTRWDYGGKLFTGFDEYQRNAGQDVHSRKRDCEPDAVHSSRSMTSYRPAPCPNTHAWCLLGFVSSEDEAAKSRGEVALLASAHQQFPNVQLRLVIPEHGPSRDAAANLPYDWALPDVPLSFDEGPLRRALSISRLPSLVLVDPSGGVAWRHDGLTPPAELGLALRSLVGNPRYAEMSAEMASDQ
ncbi:MAG: right-handed parallel beta-helix repeat-containing protein [Acidobacteriaceae bacterium]|nr:right-handed parallel beta-helix repeat-containing protein [Acidobacteriaceae bacterium]